MPPKFDYLSAAIPDFIQASISLTLNFQRRPIFAAGIFLLSIQSSTVSRLTPRYSHISFIEYQRSMLESIRFSSLSDSYNYTNLAYHTERLKAMIIAGFTLCNAVAEVSGIIAFLQCQTLNH